MTEEEKALYSIGNVIPNAEAGKLFGKPCFKVNGNAFICFFQNSMVCKLTDTEHKKAMSLTGSQLFDPSGKSRPMKEWVQIPYAFVSLWSNYATSAFLFVKG